MRGVGFTREAAYLKNRAEGEVGKEPSTSALESIYVIVSSYSLSAARKEVEFGWNNLF